MEWIQNFFVQGGPFMYIILAIFLIGVAFVLERLIRLKSLDINSSSFMNEIQKLVLSNNVKEAIQYCSGSKAALPQIIKSGLKRSSQGTDQIQNAIDATALDMIPRAEKNLSLLGLLANVSTLLGLLGTIFGLIAAFEAVGAADPADKARVLSEGISQAMNTTAAGLISAIILMVFHNLLSSRAGRVISNIDQYSVKLLDILGTMKVVGRD